MEVLYQVPGDPEPDVRIETVIKAVLVLDGTELCTIGFLPRHVAARPEEAARLHNKLAQIIEFYDLTPVGYGVKKLCHSMPFKLLQRFLSRRISCWRIVK